MRARGMGFLGAGLLAVSCFLPNVEFDPNAGKGAAGREGVGGSAGSAGMGAGAGAGGSAGKGGSGGTGGSTAQGGEGGTGKGDEIEEKCFQYCETYFDACEFEVANTYDDELDCIVTCSSTGWPLGTFEEPGTIMCRLRHAGFALGGLKDPHCFHSAEIPSKGMCE